MCLCVGGVIMNLRTIVLVCAACVVSNGHVSAQVRALSVNPEALEFDGAALGSPAAARYRLQLFTDGADLGRATPLRTIEVPIEAKVPMLVTLKQLVAGVPDGRYVAALDALDPNPLVRRIWSDPFVLSRGLAVVAADPESDRHERFWTKVGIAIGASVVLLPFLIR
jgi:hypothetical protein